MTTLNQIMAKLKYKSTNVKEIDARIFYDSKRDTATVYLKINRNKELVFGFADVLLGNIESHSISVKDKLTRQFVTDVNCIIWHPIEEITSNWQIQFSTSDGNEKIVFDISPLEKTLDEILTGSKGGLIAQGNWKYEEPSISFSEWIEEKTENPILKNLKKINYEKH